MSEATLYGKGVAACRALNELYDSGHPMPIMTDTGVQEPYLYLISRINGLSGCDDVFGDSLQDALVRTAQEETL